MGMTQERIMKIGSDAGIWMAETLQCLARLHDVRSPCKRVTHRAHGTEARRGVTTGRPDLAELGVQGKIPNLPETYRCNLGGSGGGSAILMSVATSKAVLIIIRR